jgi:hypothetical protein
MEFVEKWLGTLEPSGPFHISMKHDGGQVGGIDAL